MNSYTERDTVSFNQIEKWFSLRKNVLIFGDHGVGKTTIIKDAWEKMGLKFAFFSGSTIDPWVDLIGVPKLVKKGKESFIEFARPQTIDEDLEAIFIDEYNRSPAAVRNAVLELIQFKSINGRKFPNLKVVWAAANPPDTESNYDVEEIDPAQEDRFHIILKLSGKPNYQYFEKKYGEEVANGAVKWYENLAPELKRLISPRRLDYAVDYVVNCDGEVRDVLPDERINVSSFTRGIRGNSKLKELLKLKTLQDENGLKGFFSVQKNVQPCLKDILKDYELSNLFLKYGDTEEIIAFATSDEGFSVLTYQESLKNEKIKEALESHRAIHKVNPNWFDSAYRVVLSSRAALDNFVENRDCFTHSNLDLRVADISTLLNYKSIEEIIDDIQMMNSPVIYNLDQESASNILKFFSKIDLKDFCENNKETDWVKKAYSLIFSAFEFFYIRDANLTGASFTCKGCEKLATVPPFSQKARGLGGSGTRGNNGRVSVKEESL